MAKESLVTSIKYVFMLALTSRDPLDNYSPNVFEYFARTRLRVESLN